MKQIIDVLKEDENLEVAEVNKDTKNIESKDKKAVIDHLQTKMMVTEIAESIKDYTWEEKFEWMHQKKLKGNRLYTKGKFNDAIQIYLETLSGIDLNCSDENKRRIKSELQIPCLLNMSICMLEKKEYDRAIALCDTALALQNDIYKPYYRKGCAYYYLKDNDNATENFKLALKYCNEDKARRTIHEHLATIKKIKSKKMKAFKQLFEEGSLYADQDQPKENSKLIPKQELVEEPKSILEYNDDFEELEGLGSFRYIVYPIKMTMKSITKSFYNKIECCRRRRRADESE